MKGRLFSFVSNSSGKMFCPLELKNHGLGVPDENISVAVHGTEITGA